MTDAPSQDIVEDPKLAVQHEILDSERKYVESLETLQKVRAL
jgi:hypothetical protein